jgi:iron complex transport system permease protein
VTGYVISLPAPLVAAVRGSRLHRRRRAWLVTAGLGVLALALFVATLAIGTYLPLVDVLASATGLGQNPGVDFVVHELQMPIALTAVGAGIALGVSGTLFQRLLGNPLASPEFVGISSGASLAAVAGIVLFAWSGYALPVAALVGAIAGAALIYAIAWRDGVSGYRLILIGIGISELMLALVTYMVARAEIHDAREAMHWLVGSIGQAGTNEIRVLIVALLILVPAAIVLSRSLRALELGDAPAAALGVRVEGARFALVAVAVALVAVATAAAGPVAFVALVAGPIAQRLVGPGGGGILAAGLVGASLVLAADLVAQQLVPIPLPNGVVTGAIGAPYLLWLLATMNREGSAG